MARSSALEARSSALENLRRSKCRRQEFPRRYHGTVAGHFAALQKGLGYLPSHTRHDVPGCEVAALERRRGHGSTKRQHPQPVAGLQPAAAAAAAAAADRGTTEVHPRAAALAPAPAPGARTNCTRSWLPRPRHTLARPSRRTGGRRCTQTELVGLASTARNSDCRRNWDCLLQRGRPTAAMHPASG